jgi:hypothetical protein
MNLMDTIENLLKLREINKETCSLRSALCEFLRRQELSIFHSTNHQCLEEIRTYLGWTDDSMHNFIHNKYLIHTSPHASMNIFFPKIGSIWLQNILQTKFEHISKSFHLRTHITHNNISDLGWRPYAWWYICNQYRIHKSIIISRNKKQKHRIVYSLPTPTIDTTLLNDIDTKGISLATHAKNYAYYSIIYSSYIETCAGFNQPNRTMYVPLDLLHKFFQEINRGEDGGYSITRQLLNGIHKKITKKRRIGDNGELYLINSEHFNSTNFFTLSNTGNFLIIYLLAIDAIIGGKKMSSYLKDINQFADLVEADTGIALQRPVFIEVPALPYEKALPPSKDIQQQLKELSIPYSLSMAVYEYGSCAEKFNALI